MTNSIDKKNNIIGKILIVLAIAILVTGIVLIVSGIIKFVDLNKGYDVAYDKWYDEWRDWNATVNDMPDRPSFPWTIVLGIILLPVSIGLFVGGYIMNNVKQANINGIDKGFDSLKEMINPNTKCEYCGGVVAKANKKCPNCGSAISKK